MTDPVHDRLTEYTAGCAFDALGTGIIEAAKARVLDTIGALAAGFDGEPCILLRRMATDLYRQPGPAILGSTASTSVDMAALVNGTTSRYAELNDTYHMPG